MSFEPTPAILPRWLDRDARTVERYLSGSHVGVRLGMGEPRLLRLVDVSVLGCRVERPADALIGRSVTVAFAGGVETHGWIVWSDGAECGIDFAEPLAEHDLSRIARPRQKRDG
ncbi:PilZ domain-containing protein [Sphingomonas adhaesiva]|uniref:PilZ domain-containing protein n=1 Tax=Sphingomonas adhaesiva TaxID=28212 RepID=UPI002FF8537F